MAILHLVPLSGIAGRVTIDMRQVYNSGFSQFMGEHWSGCSRTFNFEGVVAHPGRIDASSDAYAQINRTGALELVSAVGGIWQDRNQQAQRIIWGAEVVKFFTASLTKCIRAAGTWEITGPAILGLTLANTAGHSMSTAGQFRTLSAPAKMNKMTLNDVWVEELSALDVDAVLRPQMDIFFQGFGYEYCPFFDEATGAFVERH
jgi:hypothetical protein